MSAHAHRAARSARLSGKTAVVTGAAGGIGTAVSRRFAAEGAVVVAVDLEPSAFGRARGIRYVQADVADPRAMAQVMELAGEHGRVDLCVANAGVAQVEDFADGTVESWSRVLRTNLLGVMVTLQAAARTMIAGGGGGKLLTTASIAAVHGEPFASAYCASKGGVVSLTRALAVELAPHSITANAVAPGQIDTAMNAGDIEVMSARNGGQDPAEFRRHFLDANVPLRRMGTPEEVAALFLFLASDESGFVTGETVRIDGGELAV
jgi:NAD(P)-dependent dehydrogenase (short-subunit alcohol dehydrogenase family)